MAKKRLTRGERVIKFIESYCVIPEGDKVGQPVILAPFQKLFILAIYDNKYITDTAILSIARKNAKTGLIAFIVLAHLVGPEAKQNSRIISGAQSRDQAAEVYNLASKCVQLSEKLQGKIRIVPSKKTLVGLKMNVEYQAISAEGKTAHGKSPILAILDEVGQVIGPQDDFIDAITTAQGAYDHPLLIYISTQASNDSDLFSILIDDYKKNEPENMVCHVYSAPIEDDILDPETWKKANPAMGLFRSERDMKKQAGKASRMPSFENTFRNLNLNQRVSVKSPFISTAMWRKCGGAHGKTLGECEQIFGGLDLSARTDLTALILIGLIKGTWYVFPYFWTPEVGLSERAKKDRSPYEMWVTQGYLMTTPGAMIDYEYIAREIGEITKEIEVEAIAFDRWHFQFLEKEFEKIALDLKLVPWGQGFKDMGIACNAIEGDILNNRVKHGDHPVLTMCALNSKVTKDPSGNRKLDKSKTSGRIDGIVAMAMAHGVAERNDNEEEDIDAFISDPLIC